MAGTTWEKLVALEGSARAIDACLCPRITGILCSGCFVWFVWVLALSLDLEVQMMEVLVEC